MWAGAGARGPVTCVATSKCSTAFGCSASVILRATCVARLAMERFTCTRQYLAAHSSVPSSFCAQHISFMCDRTFSTMRRFFSA